MKYIVTLLLGLSLTCFAQNEIFAVTVGTVNDNSVVDELYIGIETENGRFIDNLNVDMRYPIESKFLDDATETEELGEIYPYSTYFIPFEALNKPASGVYSFVTEAKGRKITRSVELNLEEFIPNITDIQAYMQSNNYVYLSWVGPVGAKNYRVQLLAKNGETLQLHSYDENDEFIGYSDAFSVYEDNFGRPNVHVHQDDMALGKTYTVQITTYSHEDLWGPYIEEKPRKEALARAANISITTMDVTVTGSN